MVEKLDLRVRTIRTAEPISGADRLTNQSTIVLVNLETTPIRGVKLECMILAAKGKTFTLLVPDHEVPPGTPVG